MTNSVQGIQNAFNTLDPSLAFNTAGKTASSLTNKGIGGGQTIGSLNPLAKGPAPTVAPPVVMPLPDDAAVQAAKQKQLAMIAAGSGRASTILSQGSNNPNDLLGG